MWGVGAEAHARAVLLAPLIPARGVPPERVVDLRSIISSELEFMEGIDEVIELGPQPNGVDTACLTSTSCLGTLAEDHEADVFIGGTLDKSGDNLIIDLLFYDADANRILRRKTFTVNAAAGASLLDQVSPIVAEIMTGVSPQKKEAVAAMSDVEFDGDTEEMKFDPKATGIAAPEPKPEPKPTPPPAEEFDPNAFSFGSDPTDITFGDPGAITFEPGAEPAATESIDDPSVAVDEEEDEQPARTTSTPSRYEEDDEGLEFLGVEEAARDSDARPRAPAEDDGVLAESGLTSVLDVPSWVEAIGIVIAGNLDARNRPPRGGDDQDRGRRDGSRGGRG
jgi:hypothetical protein